MTIPFGVQGRALLGGCRHTIVSGCEGVAHPNERIDISKPGMIAATPAQAPAMAAIHAAAFPPPEAWSERAMCEVLAMPGAFGWLDPRGGLILARAISGEAEVLALAVAPCARRIGLGRALLDRAITTVPPMPWLLEVASDNIAARALYRFTQCGVRRKYYLTGGDALLLRREPVDQALP